MAANLPLVSVNIISYNHGKYIAEAIEGVLMQKTSFMFEIVICDDYSTDQTREILKNYEKTYPDRIRLRLRERNLGLKHNYFNNIEACNGKYVAICEGDDYWTNPFKLQKQVDFMETHIDYSMCFHSAVEFHEYIDGTTSSNIFSNLEKRDYEGSEILTNWLIPTASVLFRNNCSLKFKYIDEFLFYDIVLFLRLREYGKIHCINEAMCVYRRHPNSITNSNLKYTSFLKHIKAVDKEFHFKYHVEVMRIISLEYFKQVKLRYRQRSISWLAYFIMSLWYDHKLLPEKIKYKLFAKS